MQVLVTSSDISEAGPKLLQSIGEGLGWEVGSLWLVSSDKTQLKPVSNWSSGQATERGFAPGEGLLRRCWEQGASIWVQEEGPYVRAAFPISTARGTIGVFEFFGKRMQEKDEVMTQTLGTIGAQVGLFVQRSEGERRHQETLALLESWLELAPIGLAFIDREMRYVRINPALANANGLPVQDHLGKTLSEVIPNAAPILEPMLRRIIETGEPVIGLEASRSFCGRKGSRPFPLANRRGSRSSSK